MYKIRVKPGEEVIEIVSNFLREKKIEDAMMTLIGAVDECCISNMAKDDVRKDVLIEYKEPMEMFGIGEVLNGKPNLHCTMSREGNSAVAGHLQWAKVKTYHVDIFINPI